MNALLFLDHNPGLVARATGLEWQLRQIDTKPEPRLLRTGSPVNRLWCCLLWLRAANGDAGVEAAARIGAGVFRAVGIR